MSQEPEVIFRGSGLMAGGWSASMTLAVSVDEIVLDAGMGLRYKFTPQDIIGLEAIEDEKFSIQHTLSDCPTEIILCTKGPASEVTTRIREIGFIPSGEQESSTPSEEASVRWKRLAPVVLLLVVAAVVIDRCYPIMERPRYGNYLSLGVLPFFLFTSLLEVFSPLRGLFLNPGCNTGGFSFNLRLCGVIFGFLSLSSVIYTSIVTLLDIPSWLAQCATLLLVCLLAGLVNRPDTENSSSNEE